jgi:hypothetical protein
MERSEQPAPTAAPCEASDAQHELREGAVRAAETVRERTQGALDSSKRAAADRIEGAASALRSAGEQMRAQEAGLARLAAQAADRMEAASRRLRDEDVGALMGSAAELARRQPVAVLAAAVAAGFALSRFLKASSSRRGAGEGDPR